MIEPRRYSPLQILSARAHKLLNQKDVVGPGPRTPGTPGPGYS